MKLLEYMDRSEKALTERLQKAGFSQEAISDAVAYVKSFGYVNDERYARSYIAGRAGSMGRQRIFQELARKGVSGEDAAAAWEEETETGELDEYAALRRLVEKKYPRGASLDDKELRRLIGFLSRRGFQFHDIMHVIEEMDLKKDYDSYSI